MFQYTTTTVINSNKDSNGVTDKFKGDANAFRVTRVGTFKKDNIKGAYKRAYTAGVKEKAKITVPDATSGKVIRLNIDVRLVKSTYSEYANSYLFFKKPIVVEVIATGTAATDAAALVKQVEGLQDRFGESYIKATVAGAVITLEAKTDFQRFHTVEILEEKESGNSLVQPDYKSIATGTVTVDGKVGFGDDAYMIRSIMVPTLENTRAFGINQEERPILGGNYSQFTLRYEVEKDHDDGVWAGAKSITTHVFYVNNALVADFEAALEETLGAPIPGGIAISATNDATTLDNGLTLQLTVSGAIGNVTYASSNEDLATISATGLVTAKAAPAAGDVVLTATDSFGNVASITIEITA